MKQCIDNNYRFLSTCIGFSIYWAILRRQKQLKTRATYTELSTQLIEVVDLR